MHAPPMTPGRGLSASDSRGSAPTRRRDAIELALSRAGKGSYAAHGTLHGTGRRLRMSSAPIDLGDTGALRRPRTSSMYVDSITLMQIAEGLQRLPAERRRA